MRPSASPAARHFAVAAQAVSMIQRLTVGRDRACRQRVDEGARRKNAALRMAPADQRLGADDRFVRQPHLGLEVELELIVVDGRAAAPDRGCGGPAPARAARAGRTGSRGRRRTSPGRARGPHWRSVRRHLRRRLARWRAGAAADMQDLVVDHDRAPRAACSSASTTPPITSGSPQPGMITTNSSPPRRQTWPRAPSDFGQSLPDLDQELVAGRMARACR